MNRPIRIVWVVLCGGLAAVAPVVGDDGGGGESPTPKSSLFGDGFSLRLAGYGWAPRFDGDVRAGAGKIGLRDDLGHGDTRWAPWGELDLRWDLWDLRLSGYTISEDTSITATSAFSFGSASATAGDLVSSDLSIDSVQIEGGITFYRPFAERPLIFGTPQRDWSGPGDVDLRFGAVFGGRWIGLDHEVRVRDGGGALLGADSRDADWLALYGGPRLEIAIRTRERLRVVDHVVISGMGGVGGVVSGGGGTMFEVRAGIDVMFTPNFGLSFGYRLQNLDFDDGDYTYDGSLQGLVIGGALRF